ncbi:MAG: hypothetical protein HDT27_00175 [Subdoligranulum sp.]|nr:hypothetical protein [Subdoligranulum sp.]MBD5101118.1 hypothetical protein [Subdoligranulum sp.]
MSKKRNNRTGKPEVERQADYYRLKTDAVNDLVTANEENSPPVSEAELRAYRSGPKFRTAGWVKVVFIKAWFAGAVCYFFFWGLGGLLPTLLDQLVVIGLALGIVTDLLTNPMLRFFERTKGENARWMMVTRKTYSGFFLNIVYAYIVLFLVFTMYNMINIAAHYLTGIANDQVILGVEPVLFGTLYLGFDLLLIQMKHMVSEMLHDAVKK